MNFTPQMKAVIQVIWTLRAKPSEGEEPGIRKLNHLLVEQMACEIMERQAKPGEKPLVVRRQSWYDPNGKEEWKAIRRAIDGEPPDDNPLDVEIEISKLDEIDGAGALKAEINDLRRTVASQNHVIAGHAQEMEEFKAKAYFKQYVDMSDAYEFDAMERQHRDAQAKLKREEDIRQQYQHENSALRAKILELEKIAKAKGSADKAGVQPLYKLFIPSLASIVQNDPNTMLQDYAKLKDEAWTKMLQAAVKQPPTDIYLVFHKFNVDPASFVADKLPFVSGVVSYVFACYEPKSHKRAKMFEDASHLIPTPPVVFLVEHSTSPQSNVLQMNESKRDMTEQLHRHVEGLRRAFDYYDPITEGFAQVWIERVR